MILFGVYLNENGSTAKNFVKILEATNLVKKLALCFWIIFILYNISLDYIQKDNVIVVYNDVEM